MLHFLFYYANAVKTFTTQGQAHEISHQVKDAATLIIEAEYGIGEGTFSVEKDTFGIFSRAEVSTLERVEQFVTDWLGRTYHEPTQVRNGNVPMLKLDLPAEALTPAIRIDQNPG